mmetsp:Transcript_4235/g.6877  ORF Transcript_4235/g.6877 Transcript_4235/m.6877 type:complete len:166 (+) Transcript_4235:69-566(+)
MRAICLALTFLARYGVDAVAVQPKEVDLAAMLLSSSPAGVRNQGATSVARRELMSKALAASSLLGAGAANAEIDYAGLPYLGGQTKIDINNANVRVFTKKPGMYPSAAGKIVSHAPYKNKDDMYAKAEFTAEEAAVTKKYDGDFLYLEPKAEYIIDNINNGLYRR